MKRIFILLRRAHPARAPIALAQWAKTACALVAILLFPGLTRAHAADTAQLQLESNETLFCVMATINAAGYDEGINLPDNNPLRKQVRDYLAGRKIEVLPELRTYYRHQMRANGVQDVSQYISFALSVTGAPDFAWKTRDVDVPPDAMALEGFQSLLVRFYNEANLDELWQKVQPAYQKEIVRYHSPLLNMTGSVGAYLRLSPTDFPARHFHAVVELLTAPQLVQTFHYGDATYVVISPSDEPRMYDIRHAFLFFMIDPVMITDRGNLQQKKSLLDLMPTAPVPDDYKTDIVLLASQSLVKAVEARVDKDSKAVDRATHQGYILTPYFSEKLPVFEKQEQGLRYYAEVMIDAIDLRAETARLSNVKFDPAPLQRVAKQVVVPGPEPSAAAKTLEKAESLFTARDTSGDNLEQAKVLFGKALDQKGDPAEHAQAWSGLARVALAEKRTDVALEAFQKTLESAPDDYTRAWADVYIGMIYRSRHDFTLATKYDQDALAVNGASDKAKQAATSELQKISTNQEKQTP